MGPAHVTGGSCALCLQKNVHIVEGKLQRGIKVTGIQGRIRWQLLDDLKEIRGYCKLKKETLDRTLWRTRFGIGCGHVVRQTAA